MIVDPRLSLRDWSRRWLGTDHLPRINRKLDCLEATMSEITDALSRLATQVNAVSAAQASSFHNLQAAIDDLKAGKLDAEQQEIVGRIEAALTKLGEDAQTADDGYEPAVRPVNETPTGEVPVEEPVTDPGNAITPDADTRAQKR